MKYFPRALLYLKPYARLAVVAVALIGLGVLVSLLVPSAVFTQTLLSEPYAYPVFLTAFVVAVDALARPTWRRWSLLTALSIGLIFTGGLQFTPFLGVAVMGHYTISDSLNATARGEYWQQKTAGVTDPPPPRHTV